MKQTFSLALVFFHILIDVNANGFYTIVAPGTLQSQHDYSVSVTLHENSEPATIKVGIVGPSFNESKTLNLSSAHTEVANFKVPELINGNYKLETEGINGLIFKNSTDLIFKNKEPKIYIQTDKATYKPGDLVQYRLIVLDEETRPAKLEKPLRLGFKDGAGNFIKQINDVKLTKGVHSGEFQLSEQPVLGNWVMEVILGPHEDDTKTEKKFEVAKYVLPKFSVDIETAKDISFDDPLKITVRSKYTYGKPVKGQATIIVDAQNGQTRSDKVIEVDGKGHVEFNLAEDLHLVRSSNNRRFGYYVHIPPLNILVIMTEEYTGNKQNKTATINLHYSGYNIEVPNSGYEYNAKQPFEYKVFVKNLDGSPVQKSKLTAKLLISKQYRYYIGNDENPSEEGDFVFTSELDDNGMALFKVTLPTAEPYYNIRVTYADQIKYLPTLRGRVEKNDSKDENKTKGEENVGPLKLIKKAEKLRLDEDVVIEVKSNQNIPYYVYTVVARGNIIKQEHVKLPEYVKSHEIKFKPSFKMVPQAFLFVYFVREGELKFQEMALSFPKEFLNKIEITAPKQAKPSEEVTLNIKTDPESFVGLLGVDQSVLLLKSGNDLDSSKILNDLSSYDTSTPYIRGYGEYPGRTSGLVTLTNANYPYSTGYKSRIYFETLPISLRGPKQDRRITLHYYEARSDDRTFQHRYPSASKSFTASFEKQPKIRTEFLETWIFGSLNKWDSIQYLPDVGVNAGYIPFLGIYFGCFINMQMHMTFIKRHSVVYTYLMRFVFLIPRFMLKILLRAIYTKSD